MRALNSFRGIGVRTGLLGGALTAAAMSVAAYFTASSVIDPVAAQDVVYFRIGAGTPGSAYYGMAGQIARIISNPPGSRDCDGEASCGVEGLLGLAQTTASPIDALDSLRSQSLDAALVSADIADAAWRGVAPFKDAGAMTDLRAISNIRELVLQVLVPADSKATDVKGLAGKKIAIGIRDSDSAITARFLLRVAGLSDKKAKLVTGSLSATAEELAGGKVDALAVVEPLPNVEVAALLATGKYRLLPAEIRVENSPAYVFADWITSDQYAGVESMRAVGVPLVVVTRADLPGQIAGGLVRALWHNSEPGLLDISSGSVAPDMMSRASVPWHPSAAEAFKALSRTEPAAPPSAAPTN